ncbi:histidine phosphatase family protein [Afipia sp. TerB]
MMKTVHLVRHGHHALLGHTLCGRMPNIELDDLGYREMASCVGSIHPLPFVIQSSPQRRAQQSASILAQHFGLPIEIVSDFDEIDYGDWTACRFSELENDANWVLWNARRGTRRPPNGESMRALQMRVVRYLEQLRTDSTAGPIVIVSHAEPIRAALLHYSRIRLDDFLSIDVDPASVSTLLLDDSEVRIAAINQRVLA